MSSIKLWLVLTFYCMTALHARHHVKTTNVTSSRRGITDEDPDAIEVLETAIIKMENYHGELTSTNRLSRDEATAFLTDMEKKFDFNRISGPLFKLKEKGDVLISQSRKKINGAMKKSLKLMTKLIANSTISDFNAAVGMSGGVLGGTSALVGGVSDGNWVNIVTGALGIAGAIAPVLGPVGGVVGAVLTFLSGIFSFFAGLASPSQPPKETQEQMVERVIRSELEEQDLGQLKLEVEGAQLEYQFISSSVSNSRKRQQNGQKISKDQANGLHRKVLGDVGKLGKLRNVINQYCEVGFFIEVTKVMRESDKKKNKETRKNLDRCASFVRLYASLTVLRQLVIIDMSCLFANGQPGAEELGTSLMEDIKNEQLSDKKFLRFLFEPKDSLNRRFATHFIFDHPEENLELVAYLNTINKIKEPRELEGVIGPVIGCSKANLKGRCKKIENDIWTANNYASVFVPQGQTLTDIAYMAKDAVYDDPNNGVAITRGTVATILPYLKKSYSITFEMNLTNFARSGNVFALHSTVGVARYLAPRVDIVKSSKIQWSSLKGYTSGGYRNVILAKYPIWFKENEWVPMEFSQVNEGAITRLKITAGAFNKEFQAPPDWVNEYERTNVFISDPTTSTQGFIKNLTIRSGNYLSSPLQRSFADTEFNFNVDTEEWKLQFDMKISHPDWDLENPIKLVFTYIEGNPTEISVKAASNGVVSVTCATCVEGKQHYTNEWSTIQVVHTASAQGGFKTFIKYDAMTFFVAENPQPAYISQFTTTLPKDVTIGGYIRDLSLTTQDTESPTKGSLNVDAEYKGAATFNEIANITLLNSIHNFNYPITQYKMSYRKTRGSSILSDVRLCGGYARDGFTRDCRWYGVTDGVTTAEKHFRSSLTIRSVFIPQNRSVELYDNKEKLMRVFNGPDLIKSNCIPVLPNGLKKFAVNKVNTSVKLIKMCDKNTNCHSHLVPEAGKDMFAAIMNTSRCVQQEIKYVYVPNGIQVTFYKSKSDNSDTMDVKGPATLDDKHGAFSQLNFEDFKFFKMERTDVRALQLCSGAELTLKCISVETTVKLDTLPLDEPIASMKLPEGSHVVLYYGDTPRKFQSAIVNNIPRIKDVTALQFVLPKDESEKEGS